MKSFAVILLVVIAGAIIGAATMKVDMSIANAAPAAATSDNCEKVATANTIDIYYCQPDNSPRFYINSVGFMVLEN